MSSFANRIAALGALSASLDAFAEKVSKFTGDIGPKLDAITNKSDQIYYRANNLEKDGARIQKELNAIDRIIMSSQTAMGDWGQELTLQMQAVKMGALTLEQFIRTWGEAVVMTVGGAKKIKEVFEDADLRQYQNQIQDLMEDVRTGAADLETVIQFLTANAGDLASKLIEILDMFRQGKATLEDVQAALNAAKQAFPDGDFGALADTILQGILSGTL